MIDTEIDGDPDNIREWADWLATGLQPGLDESSVLTVRGRRVARDGWEGEGGTSYLAFNRAVVEATDDHEQRVARAADTLFRLGGQLLAAEAAMADLRDRASRGGLLVSGMTIKDPGPAPGGVVTPGSPEAGAQQSATDLATLYRTLASEARAVREDYSAWLESTLPPAVRDAEDDASLRRLVTFIKQHYPSLVGLAGAGLLALSRLLARKRARFQYRGRVSGDPRVRGQHKTAAGRRKVEGLDRQSRLLKGLGKLLSRAALPLTIGMGIHEGITTGDWVRPTLVIVGGVVAAAATTAALAALAPALPPLAVAVAVTGATILTSALIGHLYDRFEVRDKIDGLVDRVPDAVKERLDQAGDWVDGKIDGVGDFLGDKWSTVKSW